MNASKKYTLGIHLGHDASASLFDQHGLLESILQERHSGLRHDFGINIKTIDLLLNSCGVKINEISAVGISSTQQMPAINQSPNEIHLNYSKPTFPKDRVRLHGLDWLDTENGLIVDRSDVNKMEERFTSFIENNLVKSRKLRPSIYHSSEFIGFADPMIVNLDFTYKEKSLDQVIANLVDNLANGKLVSAMRLNEELKISIRGHELPAFYWSHHACHAASNTMLYGVERLIFTHDGGQGFQSGGIWKMDKNGLNLVTLHELELGQLYDYFAIKLGLGSVGGAGKLMGLAAYGQGMLFPESPFYGTPTDLSRQIKDYTGTDLGSESHYSHLWRIAVNKCTELHFDISRLGNSSHVTDKAPREIAFFIQDLIEKTGLLLLREIQGQTKFNSIGISGGFALNCPSNSNISELSNFSEVLIEPHCEDGGCSIGAAQLTYLKVNEKFPSNLNSNPSSRYANKGAKPSIQLKISEEASEQVADLIFENKTVGIFFQASEIGPRALGHRSILANPSYKENWRRVNKIKGRESWRPFAPAVLKSHLRNYFDGGPEESPFMLFNYKVKSEFRTLFPAITHLDGTSRVQTVTEIDDPLFEILSAMLRKEIPPVVMNTSLNGPGQPIIEKEEEAIDFFQNTSLDALLINNTLLVKKKST